jgi:altronate dehydratase
VSQALVEFDDIARLPLPQDNVAVAVRRLPAGTRCRLDGEQLELCHTIMEGHRFAVRALAAGDHLLSWGLPFGTALRGVAPGEYVSNQGMLEALRQRRLDFVLPDTPNFVDYIEPYALPPEGLPSGRQVARAVDPLEFAGYWRPGNRGVGTRNFIVVLGTSSRTGSLARVLAARMQAAAARCPGVDGVVAVDHTEGGAGHRPNNLELVLRTLAGFCVHPNVAAVVALDFGVEPVTNAQLAAYAAAKGYRLDAVPHAFVSVHSGVALALDTAAGHLAGWLEAEHHTRRQPQPAAALRLALQCGGSDAFSGIAGNPLAAWVAREVVRYGGAANLAETDELIGAEPYVLQNVRDRATAVRFLTMVDRFKARMAWHGESPEANPSAGNKYRGLYNIALKSIGAARKRDPEVRLDYCIDYAVPMRHPGYYFMDSPGNDLESIAGQVAAGCNLVFFTTGNGSVTNFPFVPTVKLVTTTARHRQLVDDMDVNAGAYLDGVPMDDLGRQTLALAMAVASGRRTCGERAGHAQVQLWRDWPQADGAQLRALQSQPALRPAPVTLRSELPPPCRIRGLLGPRGPAFDQVGLVVPTSLCSAQVARLAAARLDRGPLVGRGVVRRFVALPHTEGCGGTSDRLLAGALVSYLQHPSVRAAVVVEHGCEKVHNDYLRHQLEAAGLEVDGCGWASVQLDGGNQQVIERISRQFGADLADAGPPAECEVGLEAVRLGILCGGAVPAAVQAAIARLVRWVGAAGGTVILHAGEALPQLLEGAGPGLPSARLPWAQRVPGPGVYVAQMLTDHWVEQFTGMAASGVDAVLGYAAEHPLQGHPLVPLIQVSGTPAVVERHAADLDLALVGDPALWCDQLLAALAAVLSRERVGRAASQGNTEVQVTRGPLGVSL